eukprot:s2851_g4.t1
MAWNSDGSPSGWEEAAIDAGAEAAFEAEAKSHGLSGVLRVEADARLPAVPRLAKYLRTAMRSALCAALGPRNAAEAVAVRVRPGGGRSGLALRAAEGAAIFSFAALPAEGGQGQARLRDCDIYSAWCSSLPNPKKIDVAVPANMVCGVQDEPEPAVRPGNTPKQPFWVIHAAALNIGENEFATDFYDYSNENSKLDFVAYVEDMGRIYDNILQAAAALGVSDLIFFPFGMGAFLRNLHKLDGKYCQDDVGLANLRHALAKRFVQALVVAKVPFVVRLCIAPSGKGDELDANAVAFLQSILEGIQKGVGDKAMRLKPSSVEILLNADALTVAQQYANDRRTVALVNGANRRLIGNHWFSHGARMAIDENLHRRSWRMAATAYLLNGGAEVSRRHPNALAEAVKRLGGTVQELAAKSGSDVKAKILKLFRQYDESGDGRISKAEFVKMLMRLNHQQDDSEAIFKLADTNQDGFVSYHEFVYWLYGPKHPSLTSAGARC